MVSPAYDDFGNPVGSSTCKEGQIFIEPQGMCNYGRDWAEQTARRKALQSVVHGWQQTHGIVVHNPGYTQYYLHLGEISTYPRVIRKRQCLLSYQSWIMISETKVGHGDQALIITNEMAHRSREAMQWNFTAANRTCMLKTIAGHEAPTEGEAKNSWLTEQPLEFLWPSPSISWGSDHRFKV